MDKAKPKISIGIPAFNVEKSIEKIIESILNQIFQNFGVIILDNASRDKTVEICKKSWKKDILQKLGLVHNYQHIRSISYFIRFNSNIKKEVE